MDQWILGVGASREAVRLGQWQVEKGYAWVSGFWSRDEQHFLIAQAPPKPRPDNPGPAPSPEHFRVPGQWNLTRDGYQWQRGYWVRGYEGRVWIPSRYLWTPGEFVAQLQRSFSPPAVA